MTRRLAVWIALLVVFAALIVASAGAGGSTLSTSAPLESDGVTYSGTTLQSGSSNQKIAIVPIVGVISNGDSNPDGSTTGGDDVLRMLDAIGSSDRFDGVILRLDTPGGAVLASAEITAAIERLQKDHDMPVVAWMRDAAASGGYYVSAPADRIVAAPSTFTGSIGVILEYFEVSELADEVGVRAVTIKSGRLKDIGSPFRRITAEEREVLQSIIDQAYGDFVDVVADGRDMPEATVRELADGRIYTGAQAKELDLVDELGTRRTAYDAMAELVDLGDDEGDELDVVEFTRSYSFVEALSAHAAPALDAAAMARAAGGLLQRQAGAPPLRHAGNGLLSLEYRAQL